VRAGIYTRSSPGDASALIEQEARCRAYAATRGWEVVAVWADAASGLSPDRPGLRALRAAMATNRVEAVVATDAPRFGRDAASLARLDTEAEAAGVELAIAYGAAGTRLLRQPSSISVSADRGSARRRTTRRTT
jgi:DNA invertase Pin-like site-specific DNA recombinase